MQNDQDHRESSCSQGLSRAEFLKRVLGPALITGAVLSSPKVVDKFLIPPAYAYKSVTQASLPGTEAVHAGETATNGSLT